MGVPLDGGDPVVTCFNTRVAESQKALQRLHTQSTHRSRLLIRCEQPPPKQDHHQPSLATEVSSFTPEEASSRGSEVAQDSEWTTHAEPAPREGAGGEPAPPPSSTADRPEIRNVMQRLQALNTGAGDPPAAATSDLSPASSARRAQDVASRKRATEIVNGMIRSLEHSLRQDSGASPLKQFAQSLDHHGNASADSSTTEEVAPLFLDGQPPATEPAELPSEVLSHEHPDEDCGLDAETRALLDSAAEVARAPRPKKPRGKSDRRKATGKGAQAEADAAGPSSGAMHGRARTATADIVPHARHVRTRRAKAGGKAVGSASKSEAVPKVKARTKNTKGGRKPGPMDGPISAFATPRLALRRASALGVDVGSISPDRPTAASLQSALQTKAAKACSQCSLCQTLPRHLQANL